MPVRYTPRADDGFLEVLAEIDEPELRLAVGVASCATRPAKGEGPARTMRQLLLAVDPASAVGTQPRWRDAPLVPGFGARPLTEVLADVLIWRSRTAAADDNANNFRGVPTFPSGIGVPAADLHALAAGELDNAKLDLYLRACLALNWRNARWNRTAEKPDVPVTTLALLHPWRLVSARGTPVTCRTVSGSPLLRPSGRPASPPASQARSERSTARPPPGCARPVAGSRSPRRPMVPFPPASAFDRRRTGSALPEPAGSAAHDRVQSRHRWREPRRQHRRVS